MSTKYTPGPWTSAAPNDEIPQYHWSVRANSVMPGATYELAELGGRSDNDEANARLISAAPEMAEALEAIIDSATDGRVVPEWIGELLVDARSALKKAGVL